MIWRLQRDPSEEAAEVRKLLIRLSGRQMSRQRPATAPAVLAGLWVLLAMLEALKTYDLEFLQGCADYAKRLTIHFGRSGRKATTSAAVHLMKAEICRCNNSEWWISRTHPTQACAEFRPRFSKAWLPCPKVFINKALTNRSSPGTGSTINAALLQGNAGDWDLPYQVAPRQSLTPFFPENQL